MSRSSLTLYTTVSGVSWQKDFSVRRNIKKPVLFSRIRGYVAPDDVPCCYIGSKDISPLTNLRVIRLEDTIPENSRSVYEGIQQFSGTTYPVGSKHFLLTDVVGDYISSTSKPFFYKHVLSSPSVEPTSVKILNSNLEEVNENSFLVIRTNARDSNDQIISGSYEDCSVFSNYENSFDPITGEHKLYFVKYEVSGTSHYEILNQQSAFKEAGFDDISTVTGNLKPWRKVYILSPGVTDYTLQVPTSSSLFFVKMKLRSRIYASVPDEDDDLRPWFINISAGSFSANRSGQYFHYSVPEFDNQDFVPLKPYKLMVDEDADWVRSDVISLNKYPLKVDQNMYKMEILVKDWHDNIIYAYTTDTTKDGEYYYNGLKRVIKTSGTSEKFVTWESDQIVGWDGSKGFVHLLRDLPSSYKFFVSYFYEEDGYQYTDLNLNPAFDEQYDGDFYVLYTVPTGGSNGNSSSQTKSIHYLKVDRSDRIITISQDGSGGNHDLDVEYNKGSNSMYYRKTASTVSTGTNSAGQSYINVSDTSDFPEDGILVWTDSGGTRRVEAYSSKTSTRLVLKSATVPVAITSGTAISLLSFKSIYSTQGSNDYQWLVLAEVQPYPTTRIDELSVIDLRQPGGVIKEKYSKEAMKIDPRAAWANYRAFGHKGQPIPGDTATVVRVPYSILEEYGGIFTKAQVEKIILERHLAVGVVPVIIYYGAIPEISSISSTSNTVTVCWESEGSEYHYNVYYSTFSDGPWTKANSSPLPDLNYGNCYTITGLSSGLNYYVHVTSIDENSYESPRSIVWAIRTRS